MCRDEAEAEPEAEPGAPFEEELRELRLNVPQDVRASCASDAETAAASTPLVERSSSSTSRRQPGVRNIGITRIRIGSRALHKHCKRTVEYKYSTVIEAGRSEAQRVVRCLPLGQGSTYIYS